MRPAGHRPAVQLVSSCCLIPNEVLSIVKDAIAREVNPPLCHLPHPDEAQLERPSRGLCGATLSGGPPMQTGFEHCQRCLVLAFERWPDALTGRILDDIPGLQ
jgi:hypothetical protein